MLSCGASCLLCRLKGLLDKDEQESEVIKDSPDSPEPLNKKPRLSTEEVHPPERAKGKRNQKSIKILHTKPSTTNAPFVFPCCATPPTGPVSLLSMWTNRITAANSRKHQEFAGRVNSVNNKFELYQQLKEENGCVTPLLQRFNLHIYNLLKNPLSFVEPRMDVHENGKASR